MLNGWVTLVGPWARYNIAPRTYSPVLRRQGSQLILQSMRWGVVPHYSKYEDKSLSTINARGEHLTDGTSSLWNGLKGKKRCVVPVQGYYEWLKKSNTERVPHFTKYEDQKIMLLAGLWDVVTLEGDLHMPPSPSLIDLLLTRVWKARRSRCIRSQL